MTFQLCNVNQCSHATTCQEFNKISLAQLLVFTHPALKLEGVLNE